MDDTQTQQPVQDTQPAVDAVSSMSDVAGMTPPPAPVMPDMTSQTPSAPAPMNDPMPAANNAPAENADDDYAAAEDVLNEILDSLDRIEAKLDAMEKKG